ncbi:translocation protein TolB [Symmachiella macrocystis]|uniref:Translocation protein TolB n=1 Tax=Symmachiella macrocystis TaxID=2527985 RepID=A0A5C6BIM6_9PLAN|nr:c-type cytochrome domain-containing protein [Symmachiella macrocystis]TWU12023.1 translocation protein TolB [Symmachiella macrocystis]
MRRIPLMIVCIVAACAALPAGADEPAEKQKQPAPSYSRDVQRVFKKYCIACHNEDERENGLSLHGFSALMRGGDSGEKLIVPGKPAESWLLLLLQGEEEPPMPPEGEKQPSSEEIAGIARWIAAGAKNSDADEVKSTGYDAPDVPQVLPKGPVTPAIVSVAVSPDGKSLAAVRHREVVLLNADDGKVIAKFEGAEHPLNAVAFSPDGQWIAAAGGPAGIGGSVRLWEIEGEPAGLFNGHDDSIYGLAFSPDGKLLATSSYDKLIKLWDVATGQEAATLKHHTAAVFDVAFSPDGKTLASVGDDQTVKLWDVASRKRMVTLSEPTGSMNAVAFHPSGKEVAAVGIDKTLRVWSWDGKSAKIRKSVFAHDAILLDVAYAQDGKTLFTAAEDGRIKAWDAVGLNLLRTEENLTDWPHALAVHPDGKRIFAGLYDGNLLAFDTGKAQPPQVLIAGRRAEPVAEEKPESAKVAERPRDPELSSISPRTAVRGTTAKFTLSGRNIADADALFVAPGDLKAKLLPSDGKDPNKIQCEVELPADLMPRMVSLRLHTPTGSTGSRAFYVGPFAEQKEKEANDTPETATVTELPKTLVGTINRKGDRDLWRFDAPAGAEIVFALRGTGFGSKLDAELTILDDAGQVLARSQRHPNKRDAVIGYRFENAGSYLLRVEDLRFSGGGGHYYYIHAGQFAFVEGVFPLGVTAGAKNDGLLQARGFNLGDAARIDVEGKSPGDRNDRLQTEMGPTLNTVRYELSEFPEVVEVEPNDMPAQAQLLSVPGAVCGRVMTNSEGGGAADVVAFEAKQGDRLLIQVEARRAGSLLDSVIEILTAEGEPVGWQTLQAVSETFITLRDHSSKRDGIRLQNWDGFEINDYLMLGGEVIKIRALPLGPDEDVKFFANGGRLGYFGTTPQGHAVNSSVYKIELHPPGQSFPPSGLPIVALKYRNDDGGPGLGSDSQLYFDVPADGKYLVRINDVRGLSGDDFHYRLVIRRPQPDFRISMNPADPNIPRGGNLPVTINATRLEAFDGAIDVRIEGLPDGITATAGRIGPDDSSCVVTFSAPESVETLDAAAGSVQAIGNATIGDKTVEQRSSTGFGLHQVSLAPPPTLEVAVSPQEAVIEPGQEVRFQLKLKRNYGFNSRVPIAVENLPHGIRVLHVGLNGVLIPEGQTEQSFVVKCEPWVPRQKISFYATARVEATGERNSSVPILLEATGFTSALAGGR